MGSLTLHLFTKLTKNLGLGGFSSTKAAGGSADQLGTTGRSGKHPTFLSGLLQVQLSL
jgi:hypothetical protein